MSYRMFDYLVPNVNFFGECYFRCRRALQIVGW